MSFLVFYLCFVCCQQNQTFHFLEMCQYVYKKNTYTCIYSNVHVDNGLLRLRKRDTCQWNLFWVVMRFPDERNFPDEKKLLSPTT